MAFGTHSTSFGKPCGEVYRYEQCLLKFAENDRTKTVIRNKHEAE
jgi:hypothetical protein